MSYPPIRVEPFPPPGPVRLEPMPELVLIALPDGSRLEVSKHPRIRGRSWWMRWHPRASPAFLGGGASPLV